VKQKTDHSFLQGEGTTRGGANEQSVAPNTGGEGTITEEGRKRNQSRLGVEKRELCAKKVDPI